VVLAGALLLPFDLFYRVYFLRVDNIQYQHSRFALIIFLILDVIFVFTTRQVFRGYLEYIRKRGYNLIRILVAGAGVVGCHLVDKIAQHGELGYRVEGFIDDDPEKQSLVYHGVPVIGTVDDLERIIEEREIDRHVDQIYVALPLSAHGRMQQIFRVSREKLVGIRVVPDLMEFITFRAGVEDLDGLPIVDLDRSPMHEFHYLIKRSVDIVFSLLALVLLSPVFGLAAMGVWLSSKGPILYSQERMGMDGKPFVMYKFRTMRTDAEATTGPVWARADDPRRTALGTWLRRLSIDELPQFYNVLRGDMSVVGPRPERPNFVHEFKRKIPQYMLRHKVKAGITGWAQINGWRGNTSVTKRIEHDLYYIENWSLTLDFKIMWLTLWRGFFSQKNAY
jgi:Undecaprenyl-phosphate glucose phosphotransferase